MRHNPRTSFSNQLCWLAFAITLIAGSGIALAQKKPAIDKPKNIIILFADGVAGTQIDFGRYSSELLRQQEFALTSIVMNQGSFGLMHTESATAYVTDSAAAGSAMSIGQKVNNGVISITPDGRSPSTILALAKQQGKKIGIISTAAIYDASPAAFTVHAKSRRDSEHIVNQYAELMPDVLMGGGADYFKPKNEIGGKRQDGRNMIDFFKAKNYQVVQDTKQLAGIKPGKVLGLFSDEDLDFEIDRDTALQPSLAQMLGAALQALAGQLTPRSNGFILFVENENTDSAGHRNDVAALMRDLWSFDDAIKVAIAFQKKSPDTLIIVTSDHETGGFSPTYGRKNNGPSGANNYLNVTASELKQIAEYKISLQEATDQLALKRKEGYSKEKLSEFLSEQLLKNFPELNLDADLREKILLNQSLGLNFNYSTANSLGMAIARQTGFYWGTSGHTSEPVIVAAIGPGAKIFNGYLDNTDFAKKIKQLLEIQ